MILINLLILLVAAMGATAAPNALVDAGTAAALETRDNDEWKFCGNFAAADREGSIKLAHQVRNGEFGEQWEVSGTVYTDPHTNSSCLGVGCDTATYAQVWICNDNTYNIFEDSRNVSYWMYRIIDECCTDEESSGVSGQYFLGDGTNINIAHGECQTYSNPSDQGPGPGECKG